MKRRLFLSSTVAGLSAALAGCISGGRGRGPGGEAPTARLDMEALEVAAYPAKVLYTVPDAGDSQLFERIVDASATVKDTRPPFPEDVHIAHGDGVYELSHEVIDQTPASVYSVILGTDEDSAPDSKTIQFSDLPAVDREKLATHGLATGDRLGIGTTLLYTDSERKRSVLVPPEYSYISWDDGTTAEWTAGKTSDTPLNTYRYAAETIATATEYGRRIRERFAFELADLPTAQSDVVETAITDERYTVPPDESAPAAVTALVDRFRRQEQVHGLDESGPGDLNGQYLVRYRGEVYWTSLFLYEGAARAYFHANSERR